MVKKNSDGTYTFKNGTRAIKDKNGKFILIDKKKRVKKNENYLSKLEKFYSFDNKNNGYFKLRLIENPDKYVELNINNINNFQDLGKQAKYYSNDVFYDNGNIIIPNFRYNKEYFKYLKDYIKNNKTVSYYWFSNNNCLKF